jgi:ABC-type nitrate/sulfonate/bicarbonate transport system permease component
MSSTSSELSALGSTTTVDLFKRLKPRHSTPRGDLFASKLFTAAWGVIAVSFASFAGLLDNLIQAVNILGSIFYGTILGLLMGRSTTFDRVFRVYINFFNAMPMIVVLPLFSLWFGYSSGARIATIIFAAIFAITMNVADGARSVPREYLEVSRSFRSGRLRMLTDIVLPASMPYLLAGFRLAAGRALIGAVVAEFFLSVGGIGYYILYNSRSYHHNEAFVGVLLLAAFGVGFELLVNWSTRHFMPWYRRDEKAT